MKLQPLTSFFPAAGRDADTIVILGTSFERRCLGFCQSVRQIAPAYRSERVLLLHYSDRGDNTIGARMNLLTPQLEALAAEISMTGRLDREPLQPYSILDAADYFQTLFDTLPADASVVVDISTVPKLHVLYILRSARESPRVTSCRLVYTRARYGRYDTLSWGSEEPVVLPHFGVARSPSRNREHLLMFCGLEPERSYSIWRRFGQTRCTLVFVDGGDQDFDRCALRAQRLNAFDRRAASRVVTAFRPSEVTALIKENYDECERNREYLYIAPMTTKWEVVGTCDFFRSAAREPDAAIVYAAPGRLNAAGHTRDDLGECIVATAK